MALVEIDNISKNYQMGEVQVPALRNITLSIEEAAFVSFVGPSGSGKTTMLNIIGCLDKPTEGNITMTANNGWIPANLHSQSLWD